MSSNAAAAAMPEAVASAAVDEFPFNDAEYAEPRKHYLEKRVRHDAELPNGTPLDTSLYEKRLIILKKKTIMNKCTGF